MNQKVLKVLFFVLFFIIFFVGIYLFIPNIPLALFGALFGLLIIK